MKEKIITGYLGIQACRCRSTRETLRSHTASCQSECIDRLSRSNNQCLSLLPMRRVSSRPSARRSMSFIRRRVELSGVEMQDDVSSDDVETAHGLQGYDSSTYPLYHRSVALLSLTSSSHARLRSRCLLPVNQISFVCQGKRRLCFFSI